MENKTNKISPPNNSSNMKNPNKGIKGSNRQYSQVQGNRGAQLNRNKNGK